jgi:type II secretory pathway component PulF
VLILFVVPTFKDLFIDLDLGLPDEAKIVFAVSDYLRDSGPGLLVGLISLLVAGSYCLRYPSFRLALEDLLRRVPVAGRLMDRMALMRLARNLHLLLRNGIALSSSLDQCVGLVGSERLRKAVIEVQQKIRRGSRLAESMKSTGAFPGMIVGLVSAGEESGQLSETLLHIHGSLDREVRERFAHLLNLVTPLVTVALGLVVGGIAVTLLSTLFSLYSAVGE